MRDLLVAGGGPVGLAAALHARRAGLDVGVVEPRPGVIDKACGEGLMPGALAALADLGGTRTAAAERDPLPRRHARRRGAVPPRPGRGVRRTTLHAALAAAAAEAGIGTDHRPVRAVEDRGDHLLVDGVPTRYLLAADGLHSPVRRLLGLDRPVRGRRRYGQRGHLATTPWTSMVEVHWSAIGEAYVTPVAADLVGVAVLSDVRRPAADLLPCFPRLADRLAGADLAAVRGAGPLRQRASRRVAGRVLLVGDRGRLRRRAHRRGPRTGARPGPRGGGGGGRRPSGPLRARRPPAGSAPRAAHPRAAAGDPAARRTPAAGAARRGGPGRLRRRGRPAREAGVSAGQSPGDGVELVVLLDERGGAIGTTPKAEVHHAATPLHLAFSCYLFDDRGRLLLTRRALHKPTWPGAWTNSVCGHPAPGEDLHDAVRRRVLAEVGVRARGVRLLLPGFAIAR